MVNLRKIKSFGNVETTRGLIREQGMNQIGYGAAGCTESLSSTLLFKFVSLTAFLTGVLLLVQQAAASVGGEVIRSSLDAQPGKQEAAASAYDSFGNMIITGTTKSIGGNDNWYTIKIAPDGVVLWQKEFDFAGEEDRAVDVAVDGSDEIIVTGYGTNLGNVDILVMKYNPAGGVEWGPYVYDGSGNQGDYPVSLTIDSNEKIYVAGYSHNTNDTDDGIVIKLEPDNSFNSVYVYNSDPIGNFNDRFVDITTDDETPGIDNDDFFIVTGYSWHDHGGRTDFDYVTIKYNSGGSEQWVAAYDGGEGDDRGQYVKVNANHEVVVTGYTTIGARKDIHTIQYQGDADGNGDPVVKWEKTHSDTIVYDQSVPKALAIDAAGDVYIAGEIFTDSGMDDVYVARRQGSDGALLWKTNYDSGGVEKKEHPVSLVLDDHGGTFVTGYVQDGITAKKDFLTVKFHSGSGEVFWEDVHGVQEQTCCTEESDDVTVGSGIVVDGNLYVAGWSGKRTDFVQGTATITSPDNLTVTDTTQVPWDPGQWELYYVLMKTGANAGESRRILSNTAYTLTIQSPFTNPVQAADTFVINDPGDFDYYGVKYDYGMLNPPTVVAANVVSETQVELTWTDRSTTVDEDDFCVWRCDTIGCGGLDYNLVDCVDIDSTPLPFIDSALTPHVRYTYKVQSRKLPDYSGFSDPITVLTTVFNPVSPNWIYTYNGDDNFSDVASAIAVGSDNNPIVTGASISDIGQYDYYTAKIDRQTGADVWTHRYDDPYFESDMATCLAVTNTDEVIVSGYSSLDNGSGANTNDIFTLRFAASGPDPLHLNHPDYGSIWNDQYNGPAGGDDRSEAVDTTSSGDNTIVAGYGRNGADNDDLYVIYYDINGSIVWDDIFDGGYGHDWPNAVTHDSAGNVIVAGKTFNGATYDHIIRKYAPDGNLEWSKIYDSTYGNDELNSVTTDANGNIYAVGYITNEAFHSDVFIRKYNTLGGYQWTKLIGGDGIGYDEAVSVIYDNVKDEIVVGGMYTSETGSIDFFVSRHSPDTGEEIWMKILDNDAADDFLVDMAMDNDGNVCVAGDTDNGNDTDILSVCYGASGELISSTLYDGGVSGDDSATSMTVNSIGEMFVAGSTINAAGNNDYVVFKGQTNVLLAPGDFTATPRYTTVDLSWIDYAIGEDKYEIKRKDSDCATSGNYAHLTFTGPSATSFTDTNLQEGARYCYWIQTLQTGGLSSNPVEVDVQTLVPQDPGCTATPVNTSQLDISWTDSTDGEEGIELLRCTGAGCQPVSPTDSIATPVLGTVSYSDSTVCQDEQYTYQVRLYNTTENWLVVSDCVDVAPVSAMPLHNVSAAAVSEGEVVVSWLDSNTDTDTYNIYKCQGGGCTPSAPALATAGLDSFAPIVDLKMNDGSWADSSGNNNNATPRSGALIVSPGLLGGSGGDFDGSDDLADWVYNSPWPTNNFTMAAWIKIDPNSDHEIDTQNTYSTLGTSGQNYLFGAQVRTSPQTGAGVSVGTNGISVYEHSGGYMPALAVYSGVISTDWNHVVVTYTNKQPRIYLNGTLVKTGLTSPKSFVYAPFQVGGGSYGNFPGQIDEVKIFDYALSASEVTTLSQTGFYSDIDVLPGQSYTYSVTASKNSGCTWESAPVESTTVPTLSDSCPVITAVVDTTSINVDWADNFSFESGYEIERCEGVGCLANCAEGASCDVGNVSANVITIADTDTICPGTPYNYQVRAYKGTTPPYDWSIVCEAASATTTLAPIDPTNLTAARYSEQEVSLTWDDANDDETGYIIERCESGGINCISLTAPPAEGQGTYTDQGLVPDQTYSYRVSADKPGKCGWPTGPSNLSNDVITTLYPPSSLKAVAVSSTEILLTWINGTTQETDFSIRRCDDISVSGCDEDIEFSEVDTAPSGTSSYVDKQVCSGTTYRYQVVARNSSWPVPDQSTGISSDVSTTPNQAPFNLEITATSESEADVTWMDTNPDESGFTVERCNDTKANCDVSGLFSVLDTVEPTTPALSAAPTDYALLYRMDESAWVANTYDIIDGSGNGNYGRSSYGANTVASDVSGRAGNFAGSSDQVLIQNPITMSRFGSTLSWWMKPDSTTLSTGLFANGSYNGSVSLIESQPTQIYGETNNNCNYITFSGVTKNSDWTMYTIVFENERSYLYVNGDFFGETADYGLDNCSTTPATKLLSDLTLRYIGAHTYYSKRYYDGKMDELAFYNRALSAKEVAARFDSLAVKFLLNFEEGNWDGTAGEVYDSSIFGNNGTVFGNVTRLAEGTHKNAAYFDGNGDYINLGDVNALDAPPALSVGMWFSRTADLAAATGHGINNVLLSQSSDAENDNLEIGTQGTAIEIYLDTASGTDPVKSVEAGIQDNTWYHLVLTYDKKVTNPLKLYLDGNLLGEWPEFSGDLASSAGSPLTLGIARPGGVQFPGGDYNGYLDEVYVYRHALSPEDVSALYNGALKESGLGYGQTYTYRVKADKNPICSWPVEYSDTVEKTMPPPPAPSGLIATPVNATRIDLRWTDETGSETGYKVLRCLDTGSGCTPTEIDQLPANSEYYSDTSLCVPASFADSYIYVVAAIVTGVPDVESAPSSNVAPLPPTAPTGLTITPLSESEVTLGWTDMMVEEYGYKIERCQYIAPETDCISTSADIIGEEKHRLIDDFDAGIDAVNWNQGAQLQTVGSSTPPINITDGYGTVQINEVSGAVEMITTSTGIGSNNAYNHSRLVHKNPAVLGAGDFNVEVEYSLPDGGRDASFMQYTADVRLIIYMGSDYFYVDRSHENGTSRYRGITNVGGVWNMGTLNTNDTAGKLRLARIGNTLYCYSWTGSAWHMLQTWPMDPGVTPTTVALYQYAERNETVSLRTIIDNFTYSNYTSSASQAFSFSDNALSPDTTYKYTVYPYNATCLWEDDSISQEITPQVDCPNDLHDTMYNTTEVALAWTNTTSMEEGFEIERCNGICDETGTFNKIGDVLAAGNSYLDQTAVHSSPYSYRAKAYNNSEGWSCYSNILSGTILTPFVPTNLAATRGSEVRIELAWENANVDESKFVIERGDINCQNFSFLTDVPAGQTTFSDTTVTYSESLPDNNTYCYQVKACKDDLDLADPDPDHNGWCTVFSDQATATTSLVAPDPLTGKVVNSTSIALGWNNSAESETGFVIERCLGSGCNGFTPIGASPLAADSVAHTDTEVCAGSTYRYQAKVEKDPDWSSLYTTAIELTTPPPAKVEGLSVEEVVNDVDVRQITLRWNDTNLDEDGFNLEKCEGIGCSNYSNLTFVSSQEDIAEGVDPAFWGQWGGLEASSSTTVPIDISDANGVVQINEVENGVEFFMTGSGAGSSFWNNASLHMVTPEGVGDEDFDIQVDYELPDGEEPSTVNHIYLRLTVGFPDPDGTDPLLGDYFWVQHMATPSGGLYKVKGQVNNVVDSTTSPTSDVAGKLRVTRTNDVFRAYVWTGGDWQQIGSPSPVISSGLAPSVVQFGSVLVPSDAVTIRTVVKDVRVSNMYTDSTVTPSTTYCYRISPAKTTGCSWDPAPGVDDLYSEICSLTAPAAPTALDLTVDGMAIILDWTDNSTDEDGFEILKMLDNGKFVTIKTVEANLETYTDTMAISPGKYYTYRVRAIRGTDRSGYEEKTTTDLTFWQDPICLP